jgi:hypothetical protein
MKQLESRLAHADYVQAMQIILRQSIASVMLHWLNFEVSQSELTDQSACCQVAAFRACFLDTCYGVLNSLAIVCPQLV